MMRIAHQVRPLKLQRRIIDDFSHDQERAGLAHSRQRDLIRARPDCARLGSFRLPDWP
jgi:hypothetical protein